MDSTVSTSWITGKSLHFLAYGSAGLIWNVAAGAWEIYSAANYANYLTTMTEAPAGTYSGTVPAAIPAPDRLSIYIYCGDATIAGDTFIAGGVLQWGVAASTSGPVAAAIAGMAALIAGTPFFQTWTDAANPSEAGSSIFLGEVGWPITSIGIAGGVLTVATREPHQLIVGQTVLLDGPAIGPQGQIDVDGPVVITAITPTSLTASTELADAAAISPDGCFIVPSGEPFAVISEAENSLRTQSVGVGGAVVFSGGIEVMFENNIDSDYANDSASALNQARSEFGQLVAGIMQTQGTSDFMVLNSSEIVSGPLFIPIAGQPDNTVRFARWGAVVRFAWGLNS